MGRELRSVRDGGRSGSRGRVKRVEPPILTLGGDRYVVLTEAAYRRLSDAADGIPAGWEPWDEDPEIFARDLVARREEAGFTQAALARAAGIRVETLNRIERGKTTPDFATVRKLVHALREAGKTLN